MTPDSPQTEPPPGTLVDEIVRRDAEIKNRAVRVAKPKSRLPLLMAVLAVGIPVIAWNLIRLTRQVEVFTPAELQASAESRLLLTTVAIETFQDSAGRLPLSLDEAGLADDEVSYQLGTGRYTLTTHVEGRAIQYRSEESTDRLATAFETIMAGGGR